MPTLRVIGPGSDRPGSRFDIAAKVWSAFRGVPPTSRLLAQFSALVERDSSIESIQSCLETVLQRALKRAAIVIPVDTAAPEVDSESMQSGVWNPNRRSLAAHLEQLKLSDAATLRLRQAFGARGRPATLKIAAFVPVLSSKGDRVATVVIGRKRLLPLRERECALIATGATMAGLLLDQVRLRENVRVAEAQAEALKRLVQARARRMLFSHN